MTLKRLQTLTINWHINEACNFGCSYCYAKWGVDKSPFRKIYHKIINEIFSLRGVVLNLAPQPIIAERIRLNFAGGEPFLEKELKSAIVLASDLGLAPSFISNGFLIGDSFIRDVGPRISVAGFSLDSFSPATQAAIGRQDLKGRQLSAARLGGIFSAFRSISPSTKLKVNTVICPQNVREDMTDGLLRLKPDRWKILRVIPIHGAVPISNQEFQDFTDRHSEVENAVIEDNEDMLRSYLMINPRGRFYQRSGSDYFYGPEIMTVGAAAAIKDVEFNAEAYLKRY